MFVNFYKLNPSRILCLGEGEWTRLGVVRPMHGEGREFWKWWGFVLNNWTLDEIARFIESIIKKFRRVQSFTTSTNGSPHFGKNWCYGEDCWLRSGCGCIRDLAMVAVMFQSGACEQVVNSGASLSQKRQFGEKRWETRWVCVSRVWPMCRQH